METGLTGRTTPAIPAPRGTQWTEDGRVFLIWAEDILGIVGGASFVLLLPLLGSMMGA